MPCSVCSLWLLFKKFGFWGSLAPPWNSNSYVPPWSRFMVIFGTTQYSCLWTALEIKKWDFMTSFQSDYFTIILEATLYFWRIICITWSKVMNDTSIKSQSTLYNYEIYWCNGWGSGHLTLNHCLDTLEYLCPRCNRCTYNFNMNIIFGLVISHYLKAMKSLKIFRQYDWLIQLLCGIS